MSILITYIGNTEEYMNYNITTHKDNRQSYRDFSARYLERISEEFFIFGISCAF